MSRIIILKYYISVAVVIGFANSSYTVREGDDTATIVVEVLSGSIQDDILLLISFTDVSALGELIVVI